MFFIYEFFDGEDEYEYVINKVSNEAAQIIYQVSLSLAKEFHDSDFTLYLLRNNSEEMEPVFSIYCEEGQVKERTCFANKTCNCWQKFCIKEGIPDKATQQCLEQIEAIFKEPNNA